MYKVLNYIQNYVKIKITGERPQKFINICLRRRIAVWKLTRVSDTEFTMCMLSSEYVKNIRSAAAKAGVKVKIIKKEGILYTFRKYKARKALALLPILLCAVFVLISSTLWNITVEGADYGAQQNTLKLVSELGIKRGMFMSNINSRALAEELLSNQNNLCWVGVKKRGMTLHIEIAEGTYYESQKADSVPAKEPCDIAVSKDCLLYKVIVEQGQQVTETGNTALKGQVVVAGEGKHAKASVSGIVWYKAEAVIENEIDVLTYTGEEITEKSLLFFGLKIDPPRWNWLPWNWNKKDFESYNSIYTEKFAGREGEFPFGVAKLTKKETVWEKRELSAEEAIKTAGEKADAALDAAVPDDGRILKTKREIITKNGLQYYCVTAEVLEEVGITVKVEN